MSYNNSSCAKCEGNKKATLQGRVAERVSGRRDLIVGFEVLLADKAERTGPVVGKLVKGRPSRYIVFRVTNCGVIHPVTYGTSIFLHGDIDF